MPVVAYESAPSYCGGQWCEMQLEKPSNGAIHFFFLPFRHTIFVIQNAEPNVCARLSVRPAFTQFTVAALLLQVVMAQA